MQTPRNAVTPVNRSSLDLGGQRGLSIVELMVGVAIGLLIVVGAAKLFVDNLLGNRRLLLETRVNQEMRAAADLIARDLRRAGYWRGSLASVGPTPVINPYGSADWGGNIVEYQYDRVTGHPDAGFELRDDGAIWAKTGGGTQQLTDPKTIQVTAFALPASAGAAEQWTDLAYACQCLSTGTCTETAILALPAGHASRPQVGLRTATVVIEARATADDRVKRRLEETIRIRNDLTRGACPAP